MLEGHCSRSLLQQARLAERAAARKEASEGLRAHLRAIRTATAELAAEEADR
jgi:hypothetical protein